MAEMCSTSIGFLSPATPTLERLCRWKAPVELLSLQNNRAADQQKESQAVDDSQDGR
jgi:hypothetical protein